MKLKVNLTTYVVSPVTPEDRGRIRSNGQHEQMPGYALVEVRMPDVHVLLFHPETDPCTGHIDIQYFPLELRNGKAFCIYCGTMPYKWLGQEKEHWPSGDECLLRTADAVEQYLKEEIGYDPCLRHSILSAFAYSQMEAQRNNKVAV